ncbi:Rrf2 family transcriptional regulator [Aquibium sp. LZ166]|uniref:Rrf2 family transcriptional regulator n=1 Tax=Aquibium pacificus TaxID=3153579 RepID=A0ABV3SCX5_9HYPH
MISQKAKYALRAMIALTHAEERGEVMSIAEIATAERIPKKFLEQILLDLKRNGLVESRRGKAGGYLLLRRPDRITFGEILRTIEGPIAPLPCLSRTAYRRCEDCVEESECEIRRVFSRVAEATRAVLDATTLKDGISKEIAGTSSLTHAK